MRLGKVVVIAVLGLLPVLSLCTKDNPVTTDDTYRDFTTHTSLKGDYTVKYPKSWVLKTDSTYTSHVPIEYLFVLADTTKASFSDGNPLSLNFNSSDWTGYNSGNNLSDSAYIELLIKTTFESVRDSDWVILSEGMTSVDGKAGYKWVYEYQDSIWGKLKVTDIYIRRNPVQDVITFESVPEKFDEELIDKIIASIDYK